MSGLIPRPARGRSLVWGVGTLSGSRCLHWGSSLACLHLCLHSPWGWVPGCGDGSLATETGLHLPRPSCSCPKPLCQPASACNGAAWGAAEPGDSRAGLARALPCSVFMQQVWGRDACGAPRPQPLPSSQGQPTHRLPAGAEAQAGLVPSFVGSCPPAEPTLGTAGTHTTPMGGDVPGRPAPPAAKWLMPDAFSTPALQPQPCCLLNKRSPGQVSGPGPRGGPYRGLGAAFVPGAGLCTPGTR